MTLIGGLFFLWLLAHTSWAAHPPSPCPDVFTYEGSEPEINKWYGEISLRTDDSLVGVRLNIELDRPSDLMVSWMGDTTTNDNVKFTILNLEQKLRPGPPVLTRIMVKFNRTTGSPRVRFIRLNGRKICPEDSISAHSEVPGPNKRQTTKRPDPDFEVNNYGENVNEYTNSNTNSNKRPSTQTNNNVDYNNNNNNNNNYNNNNNPPDTDYSSSFSNNNRPAGTGYRPVVTTTDEPTTTRRSTKATTRNPYESSANRPNNNNNNNNNPNTVSLQASTDSSSEITGVINGLLQDQKKNKTVIITVIDNNQQQGSQEQQNHPNTGNGARPVAVDNNNNNNNNNNYNNNPGNSRPSSNINSGSSRPNTNSKPIDQRPNNNNYNQGDSYSSNSQQQSAGSCGEVKLAVPLVTAGQSTHRGQWPWHVALYLIEGINLSYHCGGSLVSKNKVITAAHCVTNRINDVVLNSSKIVVYLGKYHQLQYSDELGVQTKQVIRINVFPSYNSSNYLGDIAVLTLSSDAEFTNYVTPVCLWDNNFTDLSEIEGKEGTVVGWGFDENDTPTEELKMAKMPVVSHETCLWSYPKFYSEFTSDSTFCAGFRNGTSVCNGDSGGGMVFKKNSKWYLRGIVSITVAKDGQRVCDTRHYVVFTDVAKYHDFISKNMR